jgi:hypothetical protein
MDRPGAILRLRAVAQQVLGGPSLVTVPVDQRRENQELACDRIAIL